VEQQQPDGFSAHFRNQAPFHRLFGYEPHRPASPARRRIAANHRDDSLSFRRLQECRRTGALPVIKSFLQTRHLIAPSDLTHGLGSQGNQRGHFGDRLATIKLPQRQSAKHGAHRLHSAAEHAAQLVTVRLLEAQFQPPISSHAPG
jgi:hypothetical protein